MNVMGPRSLEQKGLFLRYKTSIGHNSGSIKHRAMRFVSSMGFSPMADQIVSLPSSSYDR